MLPVCTTCGSAIEAAASSCPRCEREREKQHDSNRPRPPLSAARAAELLGVPRRTSFWRSLFARLAR